MKDIVRVGVIGCGARGEVLIKGVLIPLRQEKVEILGICDLYEDRTQKLADQIEKECGHRPVCTADYKQILALNVDAVIITCAWESHVEIALAAMEAGKYVGMEVGGNFAMEDCWKLVDTSERTGMPCMMLENCCYGKRELMVLNMVKKGLFGEIVACDGGYHHDLREEIAYGEENRHYRLRNYLHRNCENYPTHELGPICKVLSINRGNRLLSLTSMASRAKGLHEYIVQKKGADDKLAKAQFAQADIVKTVIRCAGGELITLTLDTTLPRAYSRGFTVRGTKGGYWEDMDAVFLDGKDNANDFEPKKLWDNAKDYEEEYHHPLWKNYVPIGGHDGMDFLVLQAFLEAVRKGTQTPIDVYDTATWMCISTLSEQSISTGGTPQPIPDFTRGRWMARQAPAQLNYSLDIIK